MDTFVRDNQLNFWLQAQHGTVIVARTADAGPPPGGWSSSEVASQRLTLHVEQTLAGTEPAGRELSLDVPVVQGARTSAAQPGLASWITAPGARAIYFLIDNLVADEDLGILPGDPETIAQITTLCRGPVPPGIPAILHTLSRIASDDQRVKQLFARLEPVVLDAEDAGRAVARLTVAKGELRIFSGIRRERVAASRAPDVTLAVSAKTLGDIMTGLGSISSVVKAGSAPGLLQALDGMARIIGQEPSLTVRLRDAAAAH
jgi:hypothetical protein